MFDERRGAKRAPISGVRVTYESAAGAQIEADVLDIAAGGLFIRTHVPLPVGKRIAVDITILGEPGPWSALGRVVWTREAAPGRPAGMGVKLIDVDDATVEAIERLVDTREPTAPGVGGPPAPPGIDPAIEFSAGRSAPDRANELGGSAPDQAFEIATATESAPEFAHANAPLAPEEVIGREPSLAVDLVVAKRSTPPAPPHAPSPAHVHSPSTPPPPVTPSKPPPEGGGVARWVVLVMLVVVAGVAAYVLFDGFLRPLGH
jgi:uncharacterized protein (TIGR02266 family)